MTEPTRIAESHWKRSVRPRFSRASPVFHVTTAFAFLGLAAAAVAQQETSVVIEAHNIAVK